MVLASALVDSDRRLAARPVGAHSRTLIALGPDDPQDAVDDRGLAHARPAGDHRDLAVDGPGHGLALGFGEAQSGLLLDPGDGAVGIDGPPGGLATEAGDVLGDAALGAVQGGEEQGGFLLDGLGDQVLLSELLLDCLFDDRLWYLQQFHSGFEQAIPVGGAVAVAGDLLQDVAHAGLGADQGVVGDAEALGDGIGGLEPDAVDVQRQAVGVLPHPLDRLVAVGLVDAHRPGGADAMGLQKHHDLAHDLLLGPGAGHPLLALGPDALQLQQSFGLLLDDVEDLLAEGAHQLAGEMRADALDHARAQVLLDAFERRGRNDPQLLGLELKPVLAVVGPGAGALDVLTGRDAGRRADDGHAAHAGPGP